MENILGETLFKEFLVQLFFILIKWSNMHLSEKKVN